MRLKWFFVALVGYSWLFKSLHAAPPSDNVLHIEPAGVLRVGKQPKQIGITPNGKKAYVTNFGEKSVDVLDLSTFRVYRRIKTGGAPVEVAFTPNGRYTFITNFSPGALWQIDTHTDQIVRTIKGHLYPKGVAVRPDGREVAFSSWWWPKGYLAFVDIETGTVRQTMRVGNRPRGLVYSADGRTVYLCHFGGEGAKEGVGLGIIDRRRAVLSNMVVSGRNTRHTVLSPNGKIVYASNTGSATIAAIDAKTGRILRRIRVGAWPKTIDVTRDGRWLFSANYAGRSLSIVDLQHGRESTRLPMPDRLSGLALSPNNQHLYATGWDTGRVWRWRLVFPQK